MCEEIWLLITSYTTADSRNIATTLFYCVMATLAIMTYMQAKKTLFVTQRKKALEKQLDQLERLSEILFLNNEEEVLKKLKVIDIATISVFEAYYFYLISNNKVEEARELKKFDNHYGKFARAIEFGSGYGMSCTRKSIGIELGIKKTLEPDYEFTDEDRVHMRKEVNTPDSEKLLDTICVKSLSIPSSFDDLLYELKQLQHSIFLPKKIQKKVSSFNELLEEVYQPLYEGVKRTAESLIHNIHNDHEDLKFNMQFRFYPMRNEALSELKQTGVAKSLVKASNEIRSSIYSHIKINNVLE